MTTSLEQIKQILFWQRLVLILWGFELLRKFYYLYFSMLDGDSGDSTFIVIRICAQLVSLILLLLIVKETFKLGKIVSLYEATGDKETYVQMMNVQQKVWHFLMLSFVFGIIMSFYYVVYNSFSS